MPTLATDHGFGRHKRLLHPSCAKCYPDKAVVAAALAPAGPKAARRKPAAEPVVPTLSPVEVPNDAPTPAMTREAWLLAATEAMRPDFEAAGFPIPVVRVSVGWPSGRSAKRDTIGQCWYTTEDGAPAIFISPVLTKPVAVLATLRHELVHASVPQGSKHRGPFVKVAKAVGLIGPWTATVAGPELVLALDALAERLGQYGHAAVSKGDGGRKVQGTRMLKVECLDCGCIVRMTRKWIEDSGLPKCGCGGEMEEAS